MTEVSGKTKETSAADLTNELLRQQEKQLSLELSVNKLNNIIKALLWHYRHVEPNLSVKITEQAEQALVDCCTHLKVEPQVTTVDRPGCYIVALTDKEGNAIVPVENNQADYDLAEKARNRRRLADEAENLANRVKNSAAGGEFSSSSVIELADTVLALIK